MSLRFLPNALSIFRMLLVAPLVWLLIHSRYEAALWVLGGAAFTDGLDGFLAKRFDWTSELGKLLDPIGDKLLLVSIFITLSVIGLVPIWLAALVVLRDVVIASGAIAYRLLFGSLQGHPTRLSKFNTLIQILYVLSVVCIAYSPRLPAFLVSMLLLMTAVTTLASGLEYVIVYSARAAAESRARKNTPA